MSPRPGGRWLGPSPLAKDPPPPRHTQGIHQRRQMVYALSVAKRHQPPPYVGAENSVAPSSHECLRNFEPTLSRLLRSLKMTKKPKQRLGRGTKAWTHRDQLMQVPQRIVERPSTDTGP